MNPILPCSASIQTRPAIAFFQSRQPETTTVKLPSPREIAALNDDGKATQVGKTP
jgi:hypothetical protein